MLISKFKINVKKSIVEIGKNKNVELQINNLQIDQQRPANFQSVMNFSDQEKKLYLLQIKRSLEKQYQAALQIKKELQPNKNWETEKFFEFAPCETNTHHENSLNILYSTEKSKLDSKIVRK